jgi:multicomponent Na+:H+ antiporter subunit F
MTGPDILSLATLVSLVGLSVAMILTIVRIILGPTLADRVLALDLLTLVALAFVCVIAVRTGLMLYLDIAIALALLGFLATVAFARYIMRRTRQAARLERLEADGESAK